MRFIKATLCCLLALGVGACAMFGQKSRTVSSVYEYLYPDQDEVVATPGIPVLHLPITVGIAFVPQTQTHRASNYWTGASMEAGITEAKKQQLLESVANNFRKYDFVRSIEVIPTAYLTPGGSFANLDQIRAMYRVDVIALVSYDQVQFTDEGAASFAYWTIVGAYVVSGERNETSTMVDTAVYDITSRRMLFRAPGTSEVKSKATIVNLSEELRANSVRGFDLATGEMVTGLDAQLQMFRERVKQQPAEFKVVNSPGYSGGGGGAADPAWLLLMLLLLRRWAVVPQRAVLRAR